jgi:hypothetical protein
MIDRFDHHPLAACFREHAHDAIAIAHQRADVRAGEAGPSPAFAPGCCIALMFAIR